MRISIYADNSCHTSLSRTSQMRQAVCCFVVGFWCYRLKLRGLYVSKHICLLYGICICSCFTWYNREHKKGWAMWIYTRPTCVLNTARYSSGTLEWASRPISLVWGGNVSAALITMLVGAVSPSCEVCSSKCYSLPLCLNWLHYLVCSTIKPGHLEFSKSNLVKEHCMLGKFPLVPRAEECCWSH